MTSAAATIFVWSTASYRVNRKRLGPTASCWLMSSGTTVAPLTGPTGQPGYVPDPVSLGTAWVDGATDPPQAPTPTARASEEEHGGGARSDRRTHGRPLYAGPAERAFRGATIAAPHDALPATHPHHRPRDVRRRRHGRGHAQHRLGHGLRHRLAALPRPAAGAERHAGLDRVVASRLRPGPGSPGGGAADRGRAALPGAPLGGGAGRGGLRHRAHPGVAGPDHGRVGQQLARR